MMKLLEIVKTIATSDETLKPSKEFGKTLGKTAVITQDVPGFIVNRLLVPFLLNAVRMLEFGVTSRENIDTGVNLGLNHPLGLLSLFDLIGLDTMLFIGDAVYDEYKDPQYAAPTLLRKMVTMGWLGRKTGKSFYEFK